MRLKDYDSRDGKRVWLRESEIELLLNKTDADHPEMDAAMLLAARCGLRRKEIVDVTPADLVSNDTGQIVRIWHGKGDKYREVFAPPELTQLALGMAKDPDEPLADVDDSTIYDWVRRCADRCLAETNEHGWNFVGPHDLRRTWGIRLLEAGVLPSVVMELGGWDDWKTFRNHYLAEFSPEALRRERSKVPWLSEYNGEREKDNYSVVSAAAGGRY